MDDSIIIPWAIECGKCFCLFVPQDDETMCGNCARADLKRVQAETARLREALEWYANEDRESVKDGILDNVNQRPANRALGRKE